MTDREKVIVGLECMANDGGVCRSDCPYFENIRASCVTVMSRDALELLKEPVEPVPEHPVVINTLACGVCHAQVARWDTVRGKRVYLFKAKYCPECGRKVKWVEK